MNLIEILQKVVFHIPRKQITIPASSLVANAIEKGCKCIFFGEDHHEAAVLVAQCAVFDHMQLVTNKRGEPLHLVMEAFSVAQQPHLDAYLRDEITSDTLIEEYNKGEEGFDLNHYLYLIDMAKEGGVQVHGGFPPRATARRAIGSEREVWEEAKSNGWLSEQSEGSPTHFEWFKSLFTGEEWKPPSDFIGKSLLREHEPTISSASGSQGTTESDEDSRTKRIFPAQVFKDTVLASTINQILLKQPTARVMAVCGRGHSDYWLGAPERVQGATSVLTVRARSREYEDAEGNTHVQERTAEDVAQGLDERLCDAVLIY